MKRRYVVHIGSRYSDCIEAPDARHAARLVQHALGYRPPSHPAPATKVVVDSTGEVVDPELWS